MEQLCKGESRKSRRFLKRLAHRWLRRQKINDESSTNGRYHFRGWTI